MSVYQHFRPEERDFIDQVLHWKEYVESNYAQKLTDFLDPREQQILKIIVGNHPDVKFDFFGGVPGTERKRAILYPEYVTVEPDDYQIVLFEIEYPKKFVTIEHRQILGTLMSLGLKRGKFGDILLKDGTAQLLAAKEIGDYLTLQLESIGKASVSLKEVVLSEAVQISETWTEVSVTASSLRLDTVISALYNLSRQKSQLYIQQGLAKVNWTAIENPAFECGEGDILSVRGHGRAKIDEVAGKTKKDKWRIIGQKQK